ncbi:MAG: hypothetical protein J6A03_11090 [Lachnospiraceae bacterium]|nr:hypothetical protein [Lachnospiraceae bacterium]
MAGHRAAILFNLSLVESEKKTVVLENCLDIGDVEWSIQDDGVIAISPCENKVEVLALKSGLTRLCAKYKGKKYYCNVKVEEPIYQIGEYVFSFNLRDVQYMSDHTFVGNKLYVINASDDKNQKYSRVTIYDVDVKNRRAIYDGYILHNLGHANSIDYCNNTDSLILGNGSGSSELKGKIYILQGVLNKTMWKLEDCVIIDMASENWGIRMNVIWGEDPDTAYVITNDNKSVHKILLSKQDNRYDGRYTVIGSWEADRELDCNNGTDFYDGKLYEAIGHDGFWVLENTLMKDSTIQQKQIKMPLFDENGEELTYVFGEGIAIKDDYVFWGCSDGCIKVFKLH